MSTSDPDAFAEACSDLVGQIAAIPSLADSIVGALSAKELSPSSSPIAISGALRGSPGGHHLKAFLKAWGSSATHLDSQEVTAVLKSALSCYRLAQERSHSVETVWTGPEVVGSEVRRTEAVVKEIVADAKKELLVVGYWLVANTTEIKSLVALLLDRARTGVQVRFIFDSGEKQQGANNFSALEELWPDDLDGARRDVYSWSEDFEKVTGNSGVHWDRKLHAKVIVSDKHDALVTSANLTQAGMLENLEMGLRVQGSTAGEITRHFDLLIAEGILVRRS